jgi:hypothetical protein
MDNNNNSQEIVKIDLTDIYYKILYMPMRSNQPPIDYSNKYYCNNCITRSILPETEIQNFLEKHKFISNKRIAKFILLVFRLCPQYMTPNYVMGNIILRNIIYSYYKIEDKFKNNPDCREYDDISYDNCLYSKYLTDMNNDVSSYIYEIYFNQPNLTYFDYIQCSTCNDNICPMHAYLSNITYTNCNYCTKKWIICGYCKLTFNKYYACKYIHK